MERNFYTDNFEQMLKEKADEFRMYPSKRVWHSIYNDLHPSRKWPSVAMSMLLIAALLLIGHLNTSDSEYKRTLALNTAPESNEGNAEGQHTVLTKKHDNRISNSEAIPATDLVGSDELAATDPGTANTGNPNNPAISTDPVSTGSENNTLTTTQTNSLPTTVNAGTNPSVTPTNGKSVVETMDAYINSNQLLADVAAANNKYGRNRNNNHQPVTEDASNAGENTNTLSPESQKLNSSEPTNKSADMNIAAAENKKKINETTGKKTDPATAKINAATDEKSWIEDYAFHNKPATKNWKSRTDAEFYITPSVGYRKLENTAYPIVASSGFTSGSTQPASGNLNDAISHKPSLNLEGGVGISYAVTSRLKLKAGLQLNYTSYGIDADKTTHPTNTSITLTNADGGYSYMAARSSSLSNTTSMQPVRVHNTTYQVSVPVGLAVKLTGNSKLEWYLGASVQPGYVMGGKANLISSDYKNYVSESSMLRKFNVNTSAETYIMYRWDGYTIQVGPQVRYQLMSTYNKKYAVKENLYNGGIKFGIIKHF